MTTRRLAPGTSRLMKTRGSSTVQYQTREQGCNQMTMVKKKRRKGLHLNPELHAGKTGTKGLKKRNSYLNTEPHANKTITKGQSTSR